MSRLRRLANKAVQVNSARHKDKRRNIPTEELRDFGAEDENVRKTMLYPRVPSVDLQLVWTAKVQTICIDTSCAIKFGPNRQVSTRKWDVKESKAEVVAARTLWVAAVNNHGGFGRWDFIETTDPWDAMNTIRTSLQKGIEP
jgi:hypothetical protein